MTQDNRPIAFFSWKLSDVQSKYTITKLEFLAIVETLKEFNRILWRQRISVYTDHKNCTRDDLSLTSQVWCTPTWDKTLKTLHFKSFLVDRLRVVSRYF